jgi:hypothetical protein
MVDQASSTGFRSGAEAGIWTTVSQSGCAWMKARITAADVGIQVVPAQDDWSMELLVRGGDQIGVIGFG